MTKDLRDRNQHIGTPAVTEISAVAQGRSLITFGCSPKTGTEELILHCCEYVGRFVIGSHERAGCIWRSEWLSLTGRNSAVNLGNTNA